MAHDVFISYSSDDKSIADTVCSYLENNSIRCWMAPRDIPPGEKYAQGILDAINGCKVMVVIFSSRANKSEHVSAEIERAMSKGIVIVPFRIEAVKPTGEMEYYLSGRHWLDALTVPLEQHIRKLVVSVWAFLGKHLDEGAVNTPKTPGPIRMPASRRRWTRVVPLIIAAVLVTAVAVLYFSNSRLNNENDQSADGGQAAAGESPGIGESSDTPEPGAETNPDAAAKTTPAPHPLNPFEGDTPAESGTQPEPSNGSITGENGETPQSAQPVNAEIVESILSDGWVKFRVKNNGDDADFNVIAKGLDEDGKMVSLEYVSMGKVSGGETAEGTVFLNGDPVTPALYIVEDYGGKPKIQEHVMLDGWVNVILINGGEPGDFDLVAKGYDASGNMVSAEPLRISRVAKNGIAKGTVYLPENPEKFEIYIVNGYGESAQIQEQMMLKGWVSVILANGGEPGDFDLVAKGYDSSGSLVSIEPLRMSNVSKNTIVKGTVFLTGDPETFNIYVVEDYGDGPKIQEQLMLEGWVSVILANGGEQGNFSVDIKGFDGKGKEVDFQTINFTNMAKNGIGKGSIYLSGDPVTFETSVR